MQNAQLGAQLALEVGQHGNLEILEVFMALAPRKVNKLRVGACSQNLTIAIGKFTGQVAERLDFGRAHEGEVLAIEKHQLPLAFVGLVVDSLTSGINLCTYRSLQIVLRKLVPIC